MGHSAAAPWADWGGGDGRAMSWTPVFLAAVGIVLVGAGMVGLGSDRRTGARANSDDRARRLGAVSVVGGVALLVGAGIVVATDGSDSGQTALHQTVEDGSPSDVARLLADGADPDATDSTGATPLMWAVVAGGENVQQLLDAGADPNLQDSDGWTALHHALPRADIAAVRLLLDAGADPTVEATHGRYEGRSPCEVAREAARKVEDPTGSPWGELEQLLCDE